MWMRMAIRKRLLLKPRLYILNNETKLSDGFISHELKLGDDGSMERTKLLTTIQILYNKLGGQDLLGGKD